MGILEHQASGSGMALHGANSQSANPENMVASGSTLYGDFGASGLWKWNGTAWSQLTSANPENMVASGLTLYGDFGTSGLWKWDGTAWIPTHIGQP